MHRIRRTDGVAVDFDEIRAELGVPGDFDREVLAAAEAAAREPKLPSLDRTDLELLTIDPPGSMDLDQAVGIAVDGDAWVVHYAIADVAAWVEPGGLLDRAARQRTQTYYSPDRRVPLHPPALGEDAASLLPDGPRPAVLWTIRVGSDGRTEDIDVRRALVASRARLTYADAQEAIDSGAPPAPIAALPHLGEALLADARRRGAIDLGLPEQQVVRDAAGRWTLELRRDLPVETWNAQISLLTGRAAATLMIDAGTGILRTLPPADPEVFPRLRRAAANLGIAWPASLDAGSLLAGLDMGAPRHAAFADLAAELLRGAGYLALRSGVPVGSPGAAEPPTELGHAGIGGPYGHVTAPLRRLVDRFATEVCVAAASGSPVPAWVDEALEEVPARMVEGGAIASKLDRTVIDAIEAFVLQDRVGEVFPADVIEAGSKRATIVIEDPAIRARCDGVDLPLGHEIDARCTEADVAERRVRFVASAGSTSTAEPARPGV